VRLWDVVTGGCRRILAGLSDYVRSIAYSPRGDVVVSGCDDGTVRIWDVESGACRQILKGHTYPVFVVAYSPQGDQVASGGLGGSVKIWDAGTGESCHTLTGHTSDVLSILYSPKGNQIASRSQDSTIRLWDIKSGTSLHTLSAHYGISYGYYHELVAGIAYSPQGDILAAGSDSIVRLWDMEKGDCRHILIGHTKDVWVVVYSPQGGQVVSAGEDGLLKLWADGTGECIHTLAGHTSRVTCVVFSPKGDQIVSGSEDNTIRLWSTTSGQCQAVVQDIDTYIRSIAWSTVPGMNYFVTACADFSVRMWKVVEDGSVCHIRAHWRPVNGELNVTKTSIKEVQGLGQLNKRLLEQRGAVGKPLHADRMRESSQKVLSLVSVVSALKEPSTGLAVESAPVSNSVAGLPEQLEESEQPTE
ncbi:MAG: quinon protein alcohol dehydrogenase-like superfamily, partial [Benniella sp.]